MQLGCSLHLSAQARAAPFRPLAGQCLSPVQQGWGKPSDKCLEEQGAGSKQPLGVMALRSGIREYCPKPRRQNPDPRRSAPASHPAVPADHPSPSLRMTGGIDYMDRDNRRMVGQEPVLQR